MKTFIQQIKIFPESSQLRIFFIDDASEHSITINSGNLNNTETLQNLVDECKALVVQEVKSRNPDAVVHETLPKPTFKEKLKSLFK